MTRRFSRVPVGRLVHLIKVANLLSRRPWPLLSCPLLFFMISLCPPYYSSDASCLLRSHHVLLFRLVQHLIVFLVRPRLVALSSLLLSLSLSPCRSHPVFIFCLAILLAFCLLFSAMRQLLSDIEKLGCGCHTRAPKPISVSCV